MAEDAQVEFQRLTAVLRGLGWSVTNTQVAQGALTITATRPWQMEPAAASPR